MDRLNAASCCAANWTNSIVDLVHVLAKHQKNAIDVKLAVDAIEMLWELPTVSTYVLVSGDRDFIHVLKSLRRHGESECVHLERSRRAGG